MSRLMLSMGFATACSLLAGCTETFQRLDGVTPDAGDAIAANTVMQMVDPWQYGVQDTDLQVPADRGGDEASGTDDAPAIGKGTSTTASD